jgi:hypothetical protein
MPAALGIHHLIIRESSPQFLAPLSFGDLSSRFSVSTRCDKFLNYHVKVKHLAPCGLHRASHDTHASTASERAAHHHGGRRRSLAEATGGRLQCRRAAKAVELVRVTATRGVSAAWAWALAQRLPPCCAPQAARGSCSTHLAAARFAMKLSQAELR